MGVVLCSGRGLYDGRCLQCGRGLWEGAWLRAVGGASLPLRSPVETPGAALGECGDPGIRDTVGGSGGVPATTASSAARAGPAGTAGTAGSALPAPWLPGLAGRAGPERCLAPLGFALEGLGFLKLFLPRFFFVVLRSIPGRRQRCGSTSGAWHGNEAKSA